MAGAIVKHLGLVPDVPLDGGVVQLNQVLAWLDPQNPAFQSGIAPFLIALLLVGTIFKTTGSVHGSRLAVCGVAAALFVSYCLVFSLPPYPPRSASQKLGYLIALSGLLSILIACMPNLVRTWRVFVALAIVLGVAWIAESKIKQGQVLPPLLILAGASVAIAAVQWARAKPVEVSVTALVGALGLAGLAFLAPSASLTQIALAIAAALGGFLLWTWPKPRLAFAEAGSMAIVAPLIWLAGQMALYSKASPSALAIMPAVALAPFIRQRLFGVSDRGPEALRPIITGLCAAALAAIALLIAYATRSTQGGYA